MWNRESTVKPADAPKPETVRPAVTQPFQPFEEPKIVASVGKSVRFKGTIFSSEELVIDGHVEGTIEVKNARLAIGPDADIHADIAAESVTIEGAVTGNVRADAKIEIGATGRANGDLKAPRIVLTDGAIVCGRVDTHRGQAEAKDRQSRLAIA